MDSFAFCFCMMHFELLAGNRPAPCIWRNSLSGMVEDESDLLAPAAQ